MSLYYDMNCSEIYEKNDINTAKYEVWNVNSCSCLLGSGVHMCLLGG